MLVDTKVHKMHVVSLFDKIHIEFYAVISAWPYAEGPIIQSGSLFEPARPLTSLIKASHLHLHIRISRSEQTTRKGHGRVHAKQIQPEIQPVQGPFKRIAAGRHVCRDRCGS